jgi:PEP-CTERM motif
VRLAHRSSLVQLSSLFIAFVIITFGAAKAKADSTTISGSGIWGTGAPITSWSAPNDTWSFSFTLPNPTPVSFFNGDPAELVTTAISNFSYILNGAAVNIPPANIIFFTTAEGGGFQIQFTAGGFDTTQGFNCADSFCEFDAFGDQLFTGTAPFITLTAGKISPVDFDQQAAQGGADGSLGTGTTTSFTGPTATPEPATLSLLALGALGILAKTRKK